MKPTCKNCQNLMIAPCSSTLYRCGISYFTKPPKERQVQRLSLYPETAADSTCAEFRPHGYLNALKTQIQ
jgi:hypothetical protein